MAAGAGAYPWRGSALVVLLCAFIAAACDGGISPPATQPVVVPTGAMRGMVSFLNWDSAGTVIDMRLVAFRNFPPGEIVQEVLQGRAVVHPPLGGPELVTPGTDSIAYLVALPAGTYQYVAVAQQFGPDVMNDWRPVGQFDLDTLPAIPSPVVISAGETTAAVDIPVDFTRLPPPPF